jgi:acyl-[acyl-carrier-protein]-phospholipid O-acyltransferase/long-chain-fatty-acid--[acyl-carrier-protein] ligase
MFSEEVQAQIKQGRASFIAMAITYFLGAFNDNFFKQACLLLAVTVGMSQLQSSATMLFSLPFILFSAYAGWFADRFSKGRVVIGAKILELCAMLVGAYGILTLNWNCVLTMVFIMSSQSTLFGPAINGSIPELYPTEYVTTANAILKLVTTLAILAGIATAGIALDQTWFETEIPFGRVLVACVVVAVSLIGVIASFGVVKRKASGNRESFPWLGPIQSIIGLWQLRKDPLLLTCVAGDAFFYLVSSLVVLILNVFGLQQLQLSATMTSLLAVSLMVGVCGGSFVAARIASGSNWPKVMGPAALIMALGLLATYGASLIHSSSGLIWVFTALGVAGLGGGLFLIPIASFIQVRPKPEEKGKIIAVSNFIAFSGIFLSGTIFNWLTARYNPAVSLFVVGLATGGAALVFCVLFLKYAAVEKK